MSALVALTVAALLPGVAQAAPAGDDFDDAIEITALPFRTTLDTTAATEAPDDPVTCDDGKNSVWLRYTAPADGMLRIAARSGRLGPFMSAYTGQRGALEEVPGFCSNSGYPRTLQVKAGTTYHLLVSEFYYTNGGQIAFTANPTAPEPNDNRASAAVTGLPATHEGDLSRATAEPGEMPPSCDATATRSVWYAYTPTRSRSVLVTTERTAISVHRAGDLSEVECAPSKEWSNAIFSATAGETYLIRLADDPKASFEYRMELKTAPAIEPGVRVEPDWRGTVDQDFQFTVYSGDPFGRPLVSGTVDLGDGTVVPATTGEFQHRYAKDGTYVVRTTGTTADGRTGTGSSYPIVIETHDVSIAAFTVPSSARPGQTKPIKVSVANTRHDEDVLVILYRIGADGAEQEVGSLTQRVPAGPSARTEFPFAYTYGETGTVTFVARAILLNRDDARPDDNVLKAHTVVS